MGKLNKVQLIGNLGADAEVINFDGGGRIARISIATTDKWKDKQTGEQKSKTTWHSVVVPDRIVPVAENYFKKGQALYVEGSLKTRTWETKEGEKRYTTEVHMKEFEFLGTKDQEGGNGNQSSQQSVTTEEADDDLPF